MKRIFLAAALAACLILSSCGFLSGGKGVSELSLPKTAVSIVYGETHTDQFFHDKVIKRADGFYEVFSRRLSDNSSDVANIRYLFTSDGTYVGYKETSSESGEQYWLELSGTSLEAYTEAYAAAGMLDRADGGKLYLTNGGYEEIETDGDRIMHLRSYNSYGSLAAELRYNKFGQSEFFSLFDDSGEAIVTIRTTYQMIKP